VCVCVSKNESTTRRTRIFISCIKGDFLTSYTNFKRVFLIVDPDGLVNVLTWIMGSAIRGFNPGKGKNIFSSKKVQTGSGTPPPLNWSRCSFPGLGGRGVGLIAHLRLEPKLGMSGPITLIPLYVFMLWMGKTSSLIVHFTISVIPKIQNV
jgi:hypothetical protein